MADALAVYQALVARGTQPALTWYGEQGRMELSGKVAANHLAKIAGYLSDELWLDPGACVLLDLPAHWKQVLWGLGAMLAGLEVRLASPIGAPTFSNEHPVEAIITNRPGNETPDSLEAVAALDLGPLALRWMGEPLAPGIHDASAEVLGSPDQLMDDSRHGSANFATWESLGTLDCGPEEKRVLIATTTGLLDPAHALASACMQLGRAGLVVVEKGNVEDIAQVEGAKLTKFIRK